MASAPLIAGWLTHYVDWRAAFIVPGAAIAAVGLALWLTVPDETPEAPRGGAKRARPALSADAIKLFLVICCFLIGASTIYNALTIAMPKLFAERVVEDGNLKDVANVVLAVYLVSGAAQLLGGHLVDKLPHKVVLLVGYAMMAPALYLVADSGGRVLVFALALVLAIILGTQPAVDSIVAHHAPAEWRSTAYGIRFVISLSAGSASVPLVGEVYDSTGSFTWIFMFLAGLAAFVLVAGTLLPRMAAETRQRPAAAE
jgi:MFS family permease